MIKIITEYTRKGVSVECTIPITPRENNTPNFKVGAKIKHPVFGNGEVMGIFPEKNYALMIFKNGTTYSIDIGYLNNLKA